ncbi:phosphoserine phosphatase SerB [Pseudohaliea rubra]|uniref:Phosphoserine phosphatase n=1 Tax=Pseudohaliea rubra DSM 19751 TaxID=1265313 RepID=A0A095XW08_9GAMM|nr:phosphoserine phosphatase SerB [Pseudohaliea rubra]KGE03886.1 Phosphoserine phosphatase [Pseudohaliea rubra DSM 19751]
MLPPPLKDLLAARPRPPSHVATLIGRPLDHDAVGAFAGLLTDHDWQVLGGEWLSLPGSPRGCLEVSLAGDDAALPALREASLTLAAERALDLCLQVEEPLRRHRRLAVFDMDSTLIEAEVIDELAGAAGVREAVSAVTERAMRGEIDFRESFRARLATLRGLDGHCLDGIAAGLRLVDGARQLVATLRTLGVHTAILSGGFDYFARDVQRRLGIHEVHANRLAIEAGVLTGEAVEPIVDGARKAALLRELAAREGLSPAHVLAVGDGANDLPMLAEAGLGVAFRAKPVVRASARQAISHAGLDCVLFLLGVPERHWVSEIVPD